MANCCGFCSHSGLVLDNNLDIIPVCTTDSNRYVELKNTCCYQDSLLENKSKINYILKVSGCYLENSNLIKGEGFIILREDYTFEGFIKREGENLEKLVVGYIIDLIGTQLMIIDSFKNSVPINLFGASDGYQLHGYSSKYINEENVPLGNCKMDFEIISNLEDLQDLDLLNEIQKKIDTLILSMNNYNFTLYRSVLDNYESIIKDFRESINENKELIEFQKNIEIKPIELKGKEKTKK